ncbi:hypothetical protein LC653_38875 [Nostoc sp. CHAB 5784]|uniref:nSTAND1 domain-containing NTPase n=1 Tax=Nostoc mirabile TaxID=2907820 RepID=UPI001E53A15D|nr:hypothetical protein [Nostoc mirabile]MCC5669623.1 hypothetical protein [Nostoc mirabile CHAB5784]
MTRSLIQTADQLYDELVNKDRSYEQIIRQVMLRMVTSSGGELARKRVLKSELKYSDTIQQQVDNVINSFLDARLLVSDKDADDQPYVEPAHDELVLGWPKLRDWAAKDKEQIQNLILQRRLTPTAIDWQKSNKQIAYLLEFRLSYGK